MAIPSHFGRDSIRGGESLDHIFPLVSDSVSVHSSDSVGAGMGGALIGDTGTCSMAAALTRSTATPFMIATPTSMGISGVMHPLSGVIALCAVIARQQDARLYHPRGRMSGLVPLAASTVVVIRAASLHAADRAWAEPDLAEADASAAVADTLVAVGAAADNENR